MAEGSEKTDATAHPVRSARRWYMRRSLLVVLLAIVLMGGTALGFLQMLRRSIQWHDDPGVAAAWVVGVTYGPNLNLTRGNPFLSWLNAHGIHELGDAHSVTSRFYGDPGGVEVWFAYRSHLTGHPELECHRVGRTAFEDDLGQAYHGFLDFEGDYVGVYLPAYDHAAHRIDCTVRWMPRTPAAPEPVSAPMRFEFDLPRALRVLPASDRISDRASQSRQGIVASVADARLTPPIYGAYGVRQRDLTFHLDIRGGVVTASNVDPFRAEMAAATLNDSRQLQRFIFQLKQQATGGRTPMEITDPYGVSLVTLRDEISPMMSMDTLRCTRMPDGVVWTAPVSGAGRGTDAVRLRFSVEPTPVKGAPHHPPVLFDLTVRVHADEEI